MERSLHAQDTDLFLKPKHAGKQMAVWGIDSFFDALFNLLRDDILQVKTEKEIL